MGNQTRVRRTLGSTSNPVGENREMSGLEVAVELGGRKSGTLDLCKELEKVRANARAHGERKPINQFLLCQGVPGKKGRY